MADHERIEILSAQELRRTLARLASQVLEMAADSHALMLLGIPTRGVPLAERIAALISGFTGQAVPVGSLDVTMYRDDLHRNPTRTPHPTRIPDSGIDGKTVVLVDDVLFSGRSIRAALDALQDIGRPAAVRLAILVDRGHRELPIRPDFVGKNLPSSRSEHVAVRLREIDGEDEVSIRS